MKHLKGRNVLILGLGASGLAMARWCVRHGASVQVWDSRAQPPMAAALAEHSPDVTLRSGPLDTADLLDLHLVLKSPGLAPGDPAIANFLQAARADRVTVAGELDLFSKALSDLRTEADYAPRVLAITGTNGKTTTTALTGLLVARCGYRVAVAGNIGPTLLDTLSQELDQGDVGTWPEVWVLELSSFQLDGIEGFEPSAAAVLNITQDHLDWHGDMARYAQAKSRIYGPPLRVDDEGRPQWPATVMVVNRDDDWVRRMEPEPVPVKGARGKAPRTLARPSIRFGLNPPQRPGDFGCVQEGGMAWLVRAHPADETAGSAPTAFEDLPLQRLMPADALRIRGRHNAANALAALALASAIGCPLAPMLHGLRDYAGEPHRVAFVARAADIEAYDDSKGTNVGATVAAINGLGQDRAPARLVLLLGGDGKGQDFTPLREPLAQYARAVALYGRDAPALQQALEGLTLPMAHLDDLRVATRWAFEQARPGDAVLLSPACASLDQFRDYRHRAEVFVAEVQAWAQDHGEVA